MERLAKLLNENKASKILDVGTGSGNFIALITSSYNKYREIIGIDTNQRALDVAKENFKDDLIRFENMDGNNMSFSDQYFDVVCLSNSLHHLENISVLFEEMKRVLHDDGIIIITEMIRNDLTKKQLSHLKLHHFAAKIDRLCGDTHNETYSETEIIDILSSETTLKTINSWKLNVLKNEEEDLPDRFKWFESTIEKLLNRVPDNLKTETLINEGNEVIDYIRENGFDTCPSQIVVMKK